MLKCEKSIKILENDRKFLPTITEFGIIKNRWKMLYR